ncbi:aminoacyl-tRNA hydrolase [bacterium]|nr:aminoacyl-tRNA hydrolase [bacterium]
MIIAGLGNPGQKYESSRHNIGFMAVDVVARDMRTSFGKIAYGSLIANFSFKGENHLLSKPQTFMNL